MLTLVVARYNEDVGWVNLIPAHVVIVNKAQLGNTGREASSYLWYIATHYRALVGDYVFCQGDPFAHCPDFDAALGKRRHYGPRLACDWNGAPHHPGLEVENFIHQCGAMLPHFDVPQKIEFTAGAQFQVTATQLHAAANQLEYRELALLADEHPQAPWIFERLWDYLIPEIKP